MKRKLAVIGRQLTENVDSARSSCEKCKNVRLIVRKRLKTELMFSGCYKKQTNHSSTYLEHCLPFWWPSL